MSRSRAFVLVLIAVLLSLSAYGIVHEQWSNSSGTRTAQNLETATPPLGLKATPQPTSSRRPYLAVVDPDGAVWIISPADRTKQKIVDAGTCPGLQDKPPTITWSARGDRIACLGSSSSGSVLVLMDLQGKLLKRIPAAGEGVWSQSGRFIVYSEAKSGQQGVEYVVADDNGDQIETLSGVAGGAAWSLSTDTLAYSVSPDAVGLYDPRDRGKRTLSTGRPGWNVPIYWILEDKELVVGTQAKAVTVRVDVRSGQVTPSAPLSGAPLWISPDASRAALFTITTSNQLKLAILELRDMTESFIDESVATLSYPSEHFPMAHVMFSADSRELCWLESHAGSLTIHCWNPGQGHRVIATVHGIFGKLTPALSYMAFISSPTGRLTTTSLAQLDPWDVGVQGITFEWSSD